MASIQEVFTHFNVAQENIERLDHFVDIIKSQSNLNKSMTVLDFGCEKGFLGLKLIDDAKKIAFLDPDPNAISIAEESLKMMGKTNYEIINKVVEEYNGSKFDLVYASVSLHHVPDVKSALTKIKSLLNPDGKLVIIEIYHKHFPQIPKDKHLPHHGFTPESLTEVVTELGFKDPQWKDCGSFKHGGHDLPIFYLTAHI